MLTVLVATRNGAATLPRVLHSYTALYPPPGGWKVVVVDNGSDDDSPRIVRSFADRLPLVCVSEPRRGKNRALNRGLRELDGDLAVFSDDDTVPDPDWLRRLRDAADQRPEHAVFAGRICPLWETEPSEWVRQWVRLAPVFGVSDAGWDDGPCEPTRVWGPNMAVRAPVFARGHRFDEHRGPDGSSRYAMGGETEFVLRVTIAEGLACWYCKDARVRHIVPAAKMTRAWILRRAFRLGRCVYRESRQKAAAGRAHVVRDAPAIAGALARETFRLASASGFRDARGTFEARWELNLWIGCLFEALNPRRRHLGAGIRA